MKKSILSLFAIVFLASQCFADEPEMGDKMDSMHSDGKHFHCNHCGFDLTAEQQAKMRAEKFKFQESKIDLEAQLKHARLAFKKVISDPKGDFGEAKSAAKEVANAMSKLTTAKELFKAQVNFKILTAEQRQHMAKCPQGHHHNFPFMGRPRMGMEETMPATEEAAEESEGVVHQVGAVHLIIDLSEPYWFNGARFSLLSDSSPLFNH